MNKKKFINQVNALEKIPKEALVSVIPNRAFELNDLLANIVGVIGIFFLFKLKKTFTS